MAVVKVFDSKGVKTVSMMDNVMDQLYDSEVTDEVEITEIDDAEDQE